MGGGRRRDVNPPLSTYSVSLPARLKDPDDNKRMGNRISKKRRLPTISSTSSDNNDGSLSLHSGSRSSEMRVPITEAEVERQHYLHFLLKHIFQTNYFAPIDPLVAKQQHSDGSIMMALDISGGYCPTWLMGNVSSSFYSESTH